MDGRLAQPRKRSPRANIATGPRFHVPFEIPHRIRRVLRRSMALLHDFDPPRGVGLVAAAALVLASTGYGAVKGDHVSMIAASLKDARDATANAKHT